MQSSVITIYWLLRLVYTVTLKTWTDLQCQCWNGSVRLCIKALNDWGSLPDFQSILNTPDIQLHASFSLEMHEKWKQYALKYQNVVIMLSSKWTESLSEGKKLEFMSIMWFFVKSVNCAKKVKPALKKEKKRKEIWLKFVYSSFYKAIVRMRLTSVTTLLIEKSVLFFSVPIYFVNNIGMNYH